MVFKIRGYFRRRRNLNRNRSALIIYCQLYTKVFCKVDTFLFAPEMFVSLRRIENGRIIEVLGRECGTVTRRKQRRKPLKSIMNN